MTISRIHEAGVREIVTKRKQLGFTAEFKDFVSEHPGFVRDALSLISKLKGERGPITVGSLEGERLGDMEYRHSTLFKITAASGEKFFVKQEKLFKRYQGYNEFESSIKARDLLKDLPGVEVVEACLGFSREPHKNEFNVFGERRLKEEYFVSKWIDNVVPLDVYLRAWVADDEERKERERVVKLFDKIYERLSLNFDDVNAANMFYDIMTKKIIVYDLNRG